MCFNSSRVCLLSCVFTLADWRSLLKIPRIHPKSENYGKHHKKVGFGVNPDSTRRRVISKTVFSQKAEHQKIISRICPHQPKLGNINRQNVKTLKSTHERVHAPQDNRRRAQPVSSTWKSSVANAFVVHRNHIDVSLRRSVDSWAGVSDGAPQNCCTS